MLKDKTVAQVVDEEIRALLGDAIEQDDPIDAEDTLVAVGLNSLALARLIIALEVEIGVDPFDEDHSIAAVRSVAGLVEAYESKLAATEVLRSS
jgi:acyl carrier protein